MVQVVSDFYTDADGDGLGSGSALSFCDATVPGGFVANNDDSDDACFSNVHDCFGECDGTGWVSDCGCVAGDNDGNDCDDCFGVPNGSAWDSDCGCVPEDNDGNDCDDCAGTPMVITWKIIVKYVIVIAPMTVCRIVLVIGVAVQ